MQVTKYTEAIPVDQLKVGDVVVTTYSFMYISSIKSIQKFNSKFKAFNIKYLGADSKDAVYNTSYSYDNKYVNLVGLVGYSYVYVLRMDNKEEFKKVNSSWYRLEKDLANSCSLHGIISIVQNKSPEYYNARELIMRLGGLEEIKDYVVNIVEVSLFKLSTTEDSRLLVDLDLDTSLVDNIGSVIGDMSKLILDGEELGILKSRAQEWALAYTELEEARRRMYAAFTVSFAT